MNALPKLGLLAIVLGLAPFVAPPSTGQSPTFDETFIEVQTRGPIHQAFAQPQDLSQPGAVIPKEPPPAIPEEAPDMRPEGDNVQWIGGYWAWDGDRGEVVWISGVYRDAPPGRTYVPGYWEQTPDGWRWVSGFWAPADQPELPYVPPPPASLEIGPLGPPPGDNYMYTPGYWSYDNNRYAWRPGTYIACVPGRVWVAPRYVWTPRGCLFVNGYLDYPLDRCGLMFASVAFHRPLWRNAGWAWRPSYAVAAAPLLNSLFVDSRSGHYRYGDYYGGRYPTAGIQPWHTVGAKSYDPQYAYYRWQNRGNAGWQAGLVKLHDDRVSGVAARPPRSLVQQALVVNQTNNNNLKFAQPVANFTAPGVTLAKVSPAQQAQLHAAAKQTHDFNQLRLKTETGLAKQQALSNKTATAQALKLPAPVTGIAAHKHETHLPAVKPHVDAKSATVLKNPAAAAIKTPAAAPLLKTPTPAPAVKPPTPAPIKAATPQPLTKTPTPAPVRLPTPAPIKAATPQPLTKTPTPAPMKLAAPAPSKAAAPQPRVIQNPSPQVVRPVGNVRAASPPPPPPQHRPQVHTAPPPRPPANHGGAKGGKGK